jgi:hypothetical protein
MTSSINPNNINGVYPVAGVDNDSQGFRDNFTNIKNNFAFAASEISDIQSKAILKSALSNATLDNNFAGALISGFEVRDMRETSFDNAGATGTVTLDHTAGHYQRISASGTVTIAFGNSPAAGRVGRFRLKFTVTNIAAKLKLPVSVVAGVQYISEFNPLDNSISFATSGLGVYYFEFLTDDGGVTYSVQDLHRQKLATDYAYANVSNGFTISVTNRLIIDSVAAELSNGNVFLPQNPLDGQTVNISTSRLIDRLILLPNVAGGHTIGGNISTLAASASVSYTYVAQNSKKMWFKTQG